MKNKYIFLAFLCFMGVFSCGDELDLLPLDRLTTDTFYKTRSDFDGAIFSAYSSITDFYGTSTETLSERGEYWKLSLVITDDISADIPAGADAITRDVDNFLIRASDVPYAAIYTQIYEGIYRVNLVLENLDNENDLTDGDKTELAAEAKFLRAWFHFQALKLYGPAPLVMEVLTDINNLAPPNATQDALFTSILADFADAATGLPNAWDSSNTGRATAWAAKSYMGKVNVFKKDWTAAITALGDVVNNGPYELMPDYASNFSYINENNIESIFEIQYGGPQSDDNIWVFDDTHSENFKASQGSGRGWYFGATGALGAPGAKLGWWSPTQDLLNAYEPGDVRLGVSIWQDGDMYSVWAGGSTNTLPFDPAWSSTGLVAKKYVGEENAVGGNHSPNEQADFNNERWFRFAELKLLYAEALIKGGGDTGIAKQQIDDIRVRAGLPILSGGADLEQAMMQEKRVELAFEPHRWFDIVRWDLGPTLFGSKWDPKFVVYPFPQSEIDRSGGLLIQNTGY